MEVTCAFCRGWGKVAEPSWDLSGDEEWVPCLHCRGTGKVVSEPSSRK